MYIYIVTNTYVIFEVMFANGLAFHIWLHSNLTPSNYVGVDDSPCNVVLNKYIIFSEVMTNIQNKKWGNELCKWPIVSNLLTAVISGFGVKVKYRYLKYARPFCIL
jgi:hypothetical protein